MNWQRKGFHWLEAVILAVIIAIIVMVLVPECNEAKKQTEAIKEANQNAELLNEAAHKWSADNKNRIPTGTGEEIAEKLAPYLEGGIPSLSYGKYKGSTEILVVDGEPEVQEDAPVGWIFSKYTGGFVPNLVDP